MPKPSSLPPPIARDPWAWVAIAAVLPLLVRALGAPLGEPFADDFNFLRHTFFEPGSWWDGGGALIYWRPLSRQGYFGLIGPWLLRVPGLSAWIHAALLAGTTLLLYRTLRMRWPGEVAAAAASFPLMTEASRTFLLWPTTIQDLGGLFFAALAIHEAGRRRLPSAVAAIAAGLLCKETVVVAALALPWIPVGIPRSQRGRWIVALALALALWGGAYAIALRHGVAFQSHYEASLPAWPARLPWALELSLRDALGLASLTPFATRVLGPVMIRYVPVLALIGLFMLARSRLVAAGRWVAWGFLWFGASAMLLAPVYPLWGPFRAVFSSVGLGVALVAIAWAANRWVLAGLVTLRLILTLASHGPPSAIHEDPGDATQAFDFEHLARLSRFTFETRRALEATYPSLPRAATVAWRHRPLMAQHAFAHGEALQVWYRDTTLRWISWDQVQRETLRVPDVTLEFEPDQKPQVVALEPRAVAQYLAAERDLAGEALESSLARLRAADSLQANRHARVFLAGIAGKRSLARLSLGDIDGARRDAFASLDLWRDGSDARYVLAVLDIFDHRYAEAHAQLDTLLAGYPTDVSARAMLDTVLARERGR